MTFEDLNKENVWEYGCECESISTVTCTIYATLAEMSIYALGDLTV